MRAASRVVALAGLMTVPWHPPWARGQPPRPEDPIIAELRRDRILVGWYSHPEGQGYGTVLASKAVTAENLRRLGRVDQLRKLTISYPQPTLERDALQALGRMTGLHILQFIGASELSDEDLKPLAGLTGLRELILQGSAALTDAGLVHLEGLRDLRKLAIRGPTKITPAGLKGMTGLTHLQLSGAWVDDAGLAGLAPLVRLQVLHLGDTPIDGTGLAHLTAQAGLSVLYLQRTRVNAAGLAHLPASKGLRWVDVSGAPLGPQPREVPAAGLRLQVEGLVARVVDAATGAPAGATFRHQASDRGGDTIACWAISPNGRLVATGSAYRSRSGTRGDSPENLGSISVWDARTGAVVATSHGWSGTIWEATTGSRRPSDFGDYRSERFGSVLWVAFQPDGQTLVYQAEGYQVDGA